jgi:hypothetical protein
MGILSDATSMCDGCELDTTELISSQITSSYINLCEFEKEKEKERKRERERKKSETFFGSSLSNSVSFFLFPFFLSH